MGDRYIYRCPVLRTLEPTIQLLKVNYFNINILYYIYRQTLVN